MHDHSRRLIDGDHIVIFIQHCEWNIFRRGGQGSQRSGIDFDSVAFPQQTRRSLDLPIDEHASIFDPTLQSRPAAVRAVELQKMIQTLAGLLFEYVKFHGKL